MGNYIENYRSRKVSKRGLFLDERGFVLMFICLTPLLQNEPEPVDIPSNEFTDETMALGKGIHEMIMPESELATIKIKQGLKNVKPG